MARSQKRSPTGNTAPLVLIAAGIVLVLIVLIWQIYISQSSAVGASAVGARAGQPALGSDIPYPEITRASLEDARSAFDSGTAVFLDVRSVDSFNQQHIASAISLPLDQLEAQIPQLDPNAWIIPYCT